MLTQMDALKINKYNIHLPICSVLKISVVYIGAYECHETYRIPSASAAAAQAERRASPPTERLDHRRNVEQGIGSVAPRGRRAGGA